MNIEETSIINQKIRVLHLDDDQLQLNFLKTNLELINNNIIIDSETDYFKAIKKIKETDYDCLLLDYLMPIYNGLEMARKFKKITNTPIIIYTVEDIEEISEKLIDIKIDDYIKKDMRSSNYKLLEEKITSIVNKNRTQKIFKALLKNVTDSIIIINNDHNIIYYNDNFSKNYTKQSLIDAPVLNLIDDIHKDVFLKFLLDNNENSIDVIINNYDDLKYNVEIYKTIINIKQEFKILNIKDISNYNKNSDNNYQSEDRFNAIANISPDAIMTVNMWGYVTYANKSFYGLTGFSEDEIVGKHMLKLPTMEGKNLKPYMKLLKSFFSGSFSRKSIEFPYVRKDGTSGIGDAYIDIMKVNNKRELIAIIKDVTDKKKQEEEYKNIFKTSPDGIIHLDINGIIKDINSTCLELLNINLDEYLGIDIFDLEEKLGKNDINMKKIYEDLLNAKKIDVFEIKLSVNNQTKYIEVKPSLIKILEEVLGIQILLRDVTQQRYMEIEKKAYTEKLEKLVQERTNQIIDNEKMITMAKVSSMIAHDLKGPLQVIHNSLYLLELKPEKQDIYVEYIKNATEQANDLIEELSLKGKQSPINLESTDISELIDESLIQVKVSENISFEKIIKTKKKIKIDRSKFIRVFNNLFKNAIEAMPEGGKITILVEEKGHSMNIKVIDSGLGISKDKINTLFRPFQTTKSKGMGLGLAFCKSTLEAHGGNIYVESELGKGTTFTLSIPLDTNKALLDNETIFEKQIN